MKQTFAKVSEWVAAGNLATGFCLLEKVARETEKAIGFHAEKVNSFGNLKPAICWVPKSQAARVENDFYTNGPSAMFLVPQWLYSAKINEGFSL